MPETRNKNVVFCVEDSTSFYALRPLADALHSTYEAVSIEFAFLDALFDWQDTINLEDIKSRLEYNYLEVSDYINNRIFINELNSGLVGSLTSRMLSDVISRDLIYDINGFFEATNPDVLVTAMDTFPFVRQAIARADEWGTTTVAIQHGYYPEMLFKDNVENGVISPTFDPVFWPIERLKRIVGYHNGVTLYCHPHLDVLFTMGEWFTSNLSKMRVGYPCYGRTNIVTAGSPEYSTPFTEYVGNSDSLLFLSQQYYDTDSWTTSQQRRLLELLSSFDTRIDVTIRPHPKELDETIDWYADYCDVSTDNSLHEDVQSHDIVTTVNSTAIVEGVIQGKLCGIIQLPWCKNDLPLFTHEHLVQIQDGEVDLQSASTSRSVDTQKEFIRKFCYTPSAFERNAETSTNIIVDHIVALA